MQNSNIFFIKKDAGGKWSKPEAVLPEAIAANTDIGACAFSPDGKKMFFSQALQKNESDASAEIFFVARAGGEWTDPQKVTFFKDSTVSVAHPAIAPDGETIYFVSDAPNGEGGKDIWKGTLSGTECKYIENLGPQINTPGDEMFPVVRSDGTLYFSSNGHPGLGGLDIFKATKVSAESWSLQHMGIPINSNYDEFGMTFESSKEKGFFSSNRGQSRGFDAIWSFELPEMEVIVQGKVLDDKFNPIPDAMVRLVSNTGQNSMVVTKKDGSYRIKIDKDMECVMLGTARGFLNKTEKLSSKGLKDSKVFTVDLVLPASFRPVQLDNIFFEFAKWDLTPASEKGLQDLLAMLTDNPNIIIEISAHTDFVGNNADNLILSQKRAQSVVDYLINAGIPESRLVSVGHGEEKPYKVDESVVAEYAFLPLDTVLTEEFIMTLKPEEQQIANQINRRTEFKVLRMNIW
jgi:peptidoglycan-associated lipoprotein